MEIAALGHAPHLDWIVHRLAGQGLSIVPELPRSPFLVQDWLGLTAPGLLIDVSEASSDVIRHRAAVAHAIPVAYVELAAPWHPLGQQLGFMLFVGGDEAALAEATPILNALAPLSGAWLACGPAGAASFVYGLYSKLWQACMSALPKADSSESIDPPDWMALLQQQQALSSELFQTAEAYLNSLPETERPVPDASLLVEFARPPMLQPHYARTLAAVMVLALGQSQLTSDVFDQFWRNHTAT